MSPDASGPALLAEEPPLAQTVIKLTYRDGNGSFHANWPESRIDDAIADKAGLIWVDILGPDEHTSHDLQRLALPSLPVPPPGGRRRARRVAHCQG